MLFAPLIRGGNRPLAQLGIELLALPLLVYLIAKPLFLHMLPRTVLIAVAIVLVLPLLQLLPVPFAIWRLLPGHERYAEAMILVDASISDAFLPISIVPFETQSAWLSVLPVVFVFLASVQLSTARLRLLLSGWFVLVLLQALLAIAQTGDFFSASTGIRDSGTRSAGTYVNSNHLAGLMELAFPLAMALLMYFFTQHTPRGGSHWRRQWLAQASTAAKQYAFFYALLVVIFFAGLAATRSRAGIAVAIGGGILAALLFSCKLKSRSVYIIMALVGIVASLFAIQTGLVFFLQRVIGGSVIDSDRWLVFAATWKAALAFFPLGSGAGTFPEVFQAFQPTAIVVFVNHAHNDYLDWLLEGGLFSACAMGLFAIAYVQRWIAVWNAPQSEFQFIQIGAGIGLLLLLLHSIVEFHFRIPANAIFFAFIAALFWHIPEKIHENERRRKSTTRRSAVYQSTAVATPDPAEKEAITSRNPFDS